MKMTLREWICAGVCFAIGMSFGQLLTGVAGTLLVGVFSWSVRWSLSQ